MLPKFMTAAGADVHLEAEVADRREGAFIADYQAATGVKPPKGRYHVIASANDGKRGLEGRVYLNATPAQIKQLEALGYRVQGPRSRGYLSDSYAYRVDRNQLFWELVNAGYRL